LKEGNSGSRVNIEHVEISTMKYLQPLLLTAANSVTEAVLGIWLPAFPQSDALCGLELALILY
jgi:hypothetical protein